MGTGSVTSFYLPCGSWGLVSGLVSAMLEAELHRKLRVLQDRIVRERDVSALVELAATLRRLPNPPWVDFSNLFTRGHQDLVDRAYARWEELDLPLSPYYSFDPDAYESEKDRVIRVTRELKLELFHKFFLSLSRLSFISEDFRNPKSREYPLEVAIRSAWENAEESLSKCLQEGKQAKVITSEAWYKEAQGLPTVGYHAASLANWEGIQEKGLRPGAFQGFSGASAEWMTEEGFYPSVPNFFSVSPKNTYFTEGYDVLLEVDVTGLDIWADLPSLVDTGAQVGSDGELWWDEGMTPEPLQNFLRSEDPDEEGSLYIDLEDRFFTLACIRVTETFAVSGHISPRRIKRVR